MRAAAQKRTWVCPAELACSPFILSAAVMYAWRCRYRAKHIQVARRHDCCQQGSHSSVSSRLKGFQLTALTEFERSVHKIAANLVLRSSLCPWRNLPAQGF